jgi:hypothetical protein
MSGVRLAVQIDEEASIKTGTVVPDIDVSMIGTVNGLLFFLMLYIRIRMDPQLFWNVFFNFWLSKPWTRIRPDPH